MNKIEIIGIIAGAFSSAAPAIQTIKTLKTKQADHVSIWMFVSFLVGNVLWIAYGVFLSSVSIIMWNILGFLGNILAIYLKIKHSSKEHRFK